MLFYALTIALSSFLSVVGTRPAEACGCSRNPASERSAITLRIDAGLSPSRFERASVREPTGSPVVMKVSTMAVRISRSRFPILGSAGIVTRSRQSCPLFQSKRRQSGEETASDSFYLTILDAEGWLLDQSWGQSGF